MPDLPLPRLTLDDPENRLSVEARQRVSRTLLEFDRIRKAARSAIELRGAWGTRQGVIEMREADVEATRTVLRVESEEYGNLGLPGSEFREIMRSRIDGMVYSLGFSILQRDALEAEFLWPTGREVENKPAPVKLSAAERVRDFMKEHRLNHRNFAKAARISPRNLTNLLSGKKVSFETQKCVADALEITPQELFSE